MPWKCENCGLDDNDDASPVCGGCGEVKFGILLLVSEATGESIRMTIPTSVGRVLLKSLRDEDCKFASEGQFQITKDVKLGGWAVQADPSAKNPTFLNGGELSAEPAALKTGDIISIGPERMRLRVELKEEG